MTKLLEEAIAQLRKLPPSEQDAVAQTVFAHLSRAEDYRLTDAQVEEVQRRQQSFRDGATANATDSEMADLWKRCGV